MKLDDMRIMISSQIKALGVPANLIGYYFLKDAIECVAQEPSLLNGITKKLYPLIAKRFKSTPTRVERAIRHAIETRWLRGNINLQNKLFGCTINADKGKPTNSEFIGTVANYVCMLIAAQNPTQSEADKE